MTFSLDSFEKGKKYHVTWQLGHMQKDATGNVRDKLDYISDTEKPARFHSIYLEDSDQFLHIIPIEAIVAASHADDRFDKNLESQKVKIIFSNSFFIPDKLGDREYVINEHEIQVLDNPNRDTLFVIKAEHESGEKVTIIIPKLD